MEDKKYEPLERVAEKLPSQSSEKSENQQKEPSKGLYISESLEAPTKGAESGYSGTSQISQEGKACIPCGSDHFSTVAGGLSEAMRFARNNGIDNDEVLNRIAIAQDELNAFERWDGSPDKLERLPEDEKSFMNDMLDKSRQLRHQISDIKSASDLEKTAAEAQEANKDFRSKLFRMQLGKGDQEDKKKIREKAQEILDRELEAK